VLCIVHKGAGFLVNTRDRTKQDVPVFPVRQVLSLDPLLVFADLVKVAVCGAEGIEWVSKPLVSDKLSITKSHERDILRCRGLDAATQTDMEVALDLRTRRVVRS